MKGMLLAQSFIAGMLLPKMLTHAFDLIGFAALEAWECFCYSENIQNNTFSSNLCKTFLLGCYIIPLAAFFPWSSCSYEIIAVLDDFNAGGLLSLLGSLLLV